MQRYEYTVYITVDMMMYTICSCANIWYITVNTVYTVCSGANILYIISVDTVVYTVFSILFNLFLSGSQRSSPQQQPNTNNNNNKQQAPPPTGPPPYVSPPQNAPPGYPPPPNAAAHQQQQPSYRAALTGFCFLIRKSLKKNFQKFPYSRQLFFFTYTKRLWYETCGQHLVIISQPETKLFQC